MARKSGALLENGDQPIHRTTTPNHVKTRRTLTLAAW
jgi:hypothetical protein